ncbi:hypothetical protein BH20ACT17_BH20ACT17_13870 [soil metagenome]
MTVIDDPSSPSLLAEHVWRQIASVSIAWIALLVSLIAVPGILVFTSVVFVGTLVAVGVSWACARRAEPDGAWSPSASRTRTPLAR